MVIDVLEQHIGPIFKLLAVQKKNCLTLDDETEILSRNVGITSYQHHAA